MKIVVLWFKFHRNLILRIPLTMTYYGFRLWLAPKWRQAIDGIAWWLSSMMHTCVTRRHIQPFTGVLMFNTTFKMCICVLNVHPTFKTDALRPPTYTVMDRTTGQTIIQGHLTMWTPASVLTTFETYELVSSGFEKPHTMFSCHSRPKHPEYSTHSKYSKRTISRPTDYWTSRWLKIFSHRHNRTHITLEIHTIQSAKCTPWTKTNNQISHLLQNMYICLCMHIFTFIYL